jgi:hypothetical protein
MSTKLSEKALDNLRRNQEQRAKDTKYIKLEANDKVVLEFDPESIEQVEMEFDGETRLRYQYAVKDVNYPDVAKLFTVSKQVSERIDDLLMDGHTKLKIERKGTGLKTQYTIYPAT